jgi:apolipoprotein N-acyltransferase
MPHLLAHRRFRLLAALVSGVLFYFSLGLHPLWWAAWIAPVPILLAAFYCTGWREAALLSYLAAAIGLSSNFTYYLETTGPVATPILLLLQVFMWGFFILQTRAAVRASASPLTLFVYPCFLTGTSTLVAWLSPHASWGSYAYTQMDALPVIQIASVLGSAGIIFLLGLFASLVAVFLYRGPALFYALPILLLLSGLGYGILRLHTAPPEPHVRIGIASVDDFIGRKASPAHITAVWAAYSQLVHDLAKQGAKIILLPEKIAVVPEVVNSQDFAPRQLYFSQLAAANAVYLLAGLQVDHADHQSNEAWLFSPSGAFLAAYNKQHLVPALESNLQPGTRNLVQTLNGTRYGLVICRDLLFPELGRAYANLGISALLVPAWDFSVDSWMASSVADLRGVENGYSIARAGRDSFLNIADRYGHVIARKPSRALPGTSLLADLPLPPPHPTLYARFGNWFGLLNLAALPLLVRPRWSQRVG